MTVTDKLYAEREIRALGQRYANHMLAMTAERLETKGAIAAELAWRDWQLECERDARQRLEAQLAALQRAHSEAAAQWEARVAAADALWALCVYEDFPWSAGEVQDKLTEIGFLVATDMTGEGEPERCENCSGDCDTCYRPIESLAALAQPDAALSPKESR